MKVQIVIDVEFNKDLKPKSRVQRMPFTYKLKQSGDLTTYQMLDTLDYIRYALMDEIYTDQKDEKIFKIMDDVCKHCGLPEKLCVCKDIVVEQHDIIDIHKVKRRYEK